MGPREGEHRSDFQLDRDRILYTSAFRRLQAKTQVFLSGQFDFYRTRLTHSLEVAQIGRAICDFLRKRSPLFSHDFHADPDLVEGICLAHDLGHPPFGHAGERTLHSLMAAEFGGFEGNAQSLRMIAGTIYSARDGRRHGMDPTRAFLDGILKYKVTFDEVPLAENHYIYASDKSALDFIFDDFNYRNGIPEPKKRNEFRSIECQIMDWADDTAYSINDLVDSIKAGLLRLESMERWAARNHLIGEQAEWMENLLNAAREGRPESHFGRLIGDYIRAVQLIPRSGPLSGKTHRHAFDLTIDPTIAAQAAFHKKVSRELVFASPQLQQLEHKGDFVLRRVFDALTARYLDTEPKVRLLPEAVDQRIRAETDRLARARILCDHIAGMTDGFAIRTYKRLFDPDFSSIVDL